MRMYKILYKWTGGDVDLSYVHCMLIYRGCLLLKNSFVNISEVNRQCLHSLGTRSEDDFEKVSIFNGYSMTGHHVSDKNEIQGWEHIWPWGNFSHSLLFFRLEELAFNQSLSKEKSRAQIWENFNTHHLGIWRMLSNSISTMEQICFVIGPW